MQGQPYIESPTFLSLSQGRITTPLSGLTANKGLGEGLLT